MSLYTPADFVLGRTLLNLNYAYGERNACRSPDITYLNQLSVYNCDLGPSTTISSHSMMRCTISVYWHLYNSEPNDFEAGIYSEVEMEQGQDAVSVVSLSAICAVGGGYLPGIATRLAIECELCQTYFTINSWLEGITLVAAECMFILRTSLPSVPLEMTVISQAILIPVVYILISFGNSITISEPPIPNITSCYNVGESRIIVAAYVLLVVGEFEIICFTLYRSIKHYKSLASDNPLLNTLIQHNIFYFVCGFFFSLLVILAIGFFASVYGDMASNLQVAVHALLVTRMHLELWKSDRAQRFALVDDMIALNPLAQTSRSRDNDWRGNLSALRPLSEIRPLVVSDSAIALWTQATKTARIRINQGTVLPPDTIHATEEDNCWVTLMALHREEELKNNLESSEEAWRELNEVKVVLGIQTD
ncbi:hypothetical protein BDR03DRAFT_1011333 [Suillus americanus]|nr:hypothetical protein BDR03DRAFT_1011333 [Suillus americanus]